MANQFHSRADSVIGEGKPRKYPTITAEAKSKTHGHWKPIELKKAT